MLIKFVTTVSLSLAISLLIAEYSIGKISPQKTYSQIRRESLSCYQASAYMPYEFRPNCEDEMVMDEKTFAININNIGLRGKDVFPKKIQRILLVGDSFVFGYGVEDGEKMGNVLEKSLKNIEIISAGFVGDAGPDTSYIYLLKNFDVLQPDKAIVVLFPYNDLGDMQKTVWEKEGDKIKSVSMPEKWVDNEGFLRRTDTPARYKIPFLRNSHFFQLLADKFVDLSFRLRHSVATKLGLIEKGNREYELFEKCLYQAECQDRWQEVEQKIGFIVENLKKFATEKDIPIYLVIIPLKDQVGGSKPNETIFHQKFRKAGFSVMDLSESLYRGRLDDEYLSDGHFSVEGNRIAAEAIGEWIQKLQFRQSDD